MLVALHGFTETDESWQASLGELNGVGDAQVHCALLPGHGWKPCPDQSDIPSVAGTLAKTALAADGNDSLIGYSMGGRIAIQVALEHPERISRLILVACQPGIEDDAERAHRAQRDERLAEILEEDGIGPFVSWWERQPVLRTAQQLSRETEQHLRCLRLNQNPIGLAAALRCFGQGSMAPLWSRLHELNMPVLLVAGEQDPKYLDVMQRMASAIPNAQFETIPNCGHAVHRECPDQLRAVVQAFLTQDHAGKIPT